MENKTEYINRQDTIKAIEGIIGDEAGYKAWAILNAVRKMPTAERWIPVSEKLPETKTYVLTTIYIPGRQPHARSGWYEDGLFMNDNGDTWHASDKEVVAWMPLPEPYREDGEEV